MPERNNFKKELTLNQIEPGQKVKIVGITGGWGGHGRLAGLGFRPGLIVEMVAVHPFRGPVVVRVDNTQIAIGRGLARKVIVEEM
ncbi:MAG: ferrous iron transport protein A [Syntrophomonadaceae bacterium]|nr:ferrous iron transport protein A [Syntrophomonadaceae bacterium]